MLLVLLREVTVSSSSDLHSFSVESVGLVTGLRLLRFYVGLNTLLA